MSDYEDYNYNEEEDANYEYPPEEAPQQDIATTVELDYYEIEDLIRGGQLDKAITDLQHLYETCEQHNLKNYKVKILNQLLSIYSKHSQVAKISLTLSRIGQLNKQEKFTQNAVKAIITIVRGSDYAKLKGELTAFIAQLDQDIQLKAYLFLLERALEEKDKTQAGAIHKKVSSLAEDCDLSASSQLELYSLDIKYCQMLGLDISEKVHQIQLRIPKLQTEAYMSEGHISVLKLAIAENMFQSGNYESSAANIFDAFLEKTKYGTSGQLKEILKVNALVCMLIDDTEKRRKESLNALFHECSIPFKNETDIQQLLTLIQAYEHYRIEEFDRIFQKVNFKPQSPKYTPIYQKLLFKMKKQKLLATLQSYQTIKFSYITKRMGLTEQQVQTIIFELIVDQKINARINESDPKNKCLQMLPPRNTFLDIQAENLRELGKRYLL